MPVEYWRIMKNNKNIPMMSRYNEYFVLLFLYLVHDSYPYSLVNDAKDRSKNRYSPPQSTFYSIFDRLKADNYIENCGTEDVKANALSRITEKGINYLARLQYKIEKKENSSSYKLTISMFEEEFKSQTEKVNYLTQLKEEYKTQLIREHIKKNTSAKIAEKNPADLDIKNTTISEKKSDDNLQASDFPDEVADNTDVPLQNSQNQTNNYLYPSDEVYSENNQHENYESEGEELTNNNYENGYYTEENPLQETNNFYPDSTDENYSNELSDNYNGTLDNIYDYVFNNTSNTDENQNTQNENNNKKSYYTETKNVYTSDKDEYIEVFDDILIENNPEEVCENNFTYTSDTDYSSIFNQNDEKEQKSENNTTEYEKKTENYKNTALSIVPQPTSVNEYKSKPTLKKIKVKPYNTNYKINTMTDYYNKSKTDFYTSFTFTIINFIIFACALFTKNIQTNIMVYYISVMAIILIQFAWFATVYSTKKFSTKKTIDCTKKHFRTSAIATLIFVVIFIIVLLVDKNIPFNNIKSYIPIINILTIMVVPFINKFFIIIKFGKENTYGN